MLAGVLKQYMGVVHPSLKVFRADQTVCKNDLRKLNPALGKERKMDNLFLSSISSGFFITISMLLYYN